MYWMYINFVFQPGSPVYKILHLSDVHIDGQYAENTSTKCGEPLCCREYNGRIVSIFAQLITPGRYQSW